MADKKSSVGKVTTLECMVCDYREVFSVQQFKFTDGLRCNRCDGSVQASVTKPGETLSNRRLKLNGHTGVDWASTESWSTGTIDCSLTLTGLKAIQREAKKATAAIKEFEEQQKKSVSAGILIITADALKSVNSIRKEFGLYPVRGDQS